MVEADSPPADRPPFYCTDVLGTGFVASPTFDMRLFNAALLFMWCFHFVSLFALVFFGT